MDLKKVTINLQSVTCQYFEKKCDDNFFNRDFEGSQNLFIFYNCINVLFNIKLQISETIYKV